jgi:ribonucleotide reductase alpha subunit
LPCDIYAVPEIMASISMQVIKRDGKREDVSFDKVLQRIKQQAYSLEVNPTLIAQRTLMRIHDGVHTSELDELSAQLSISLMTTHPDYGVLATRILITNHHKNTSASFSDTVELIASQVHEKTGCNMNYLSEDYIRHTRMFAKELDAYIKHERDFLLDYFGFATLERQKYLMRAVKGNALERPQYLWMRVALTLWGEEAATKLAAGSTPAEALARVFETYDLNSQKYFIHATPTNFNAGSPRPQMSSCYLLSMSEDSISGIYKTLGDCAQISKYAGGIGLHIHNIRARGSQIAGNGGTSTGIVPMLRNFNATARYVDQGSKRNGSFAIYLEPWHADIEDFLKLKLNTGSEEERARDLFYALWMSDLFMERVESNGMWTLFCPIEAPGLADVWGDKFRELYERYEAEGRGRKQVDAQKLWFKILDSQIETGTPYLLYKDAANAKSNQQNLGTIKSSNLCVTPDTFILTDKGHIQIGTLKDMPVTVWNGTQWSPTIVRQTGTNQPVIRVEVLVEYINGRGEREQLLRYVDCTPYHKFIISSEVGYIPIEMCKRVEARTLHRGDVLSDWKLDDGQTCRAIVWEITDSGAQSDTYCFNEPINHIGIFNGIATGNCTEIIEYSDKDETAVCNLASIALPTFANALTRSFDFAKLRDVVKIIVRNLNRVIDINFYPIPETRKSNMRHRPIGIGVQGLADVFAMMRTPWESDRAQDFNQRLFEHIYYAAVEASTELAAIDGPYETYVGSPISEGRLQYDLWNVTPMTTLDGTLDWASLKSKIVKHGVRNSLLLAPMPTASTSQILGFNECFEPFTSNIYARRTLSGEFTVINRYLLRDLIRLGIWSEDIKQQIIARNGSVQGIDEIPSTIQALYRTSWELKQKTLIDMSAARGAFICQSQSLNLFVADPTYAKLTSMHFYSWKKGLKTGLYYLRTRAPVMAQKFTVDPELEKAAIQSEEERKKKQFTADEGCTMCSS